jgi:hypothetical protein
MWMHPAVEEKTWQHDYIIPGLQAELYTVVWDAGNADTLQKWS